MAAAPNVSQAPLNVLPGQFYTADYRDASCAFKPSDTIRVVQWNIERGYKLEKITEELIALNADIVFLQEIDVNCERSGYVDVGTCLAKALHMNYLYTSEFEELHSPLREPHTQGGGIHGNGILSKFDMHDVRVIPHRYQPIDWNREGEAYREPRRGARYILSTVIASPFGGKSQFTFFHAKI